MATRRVIAERTYYVEGPDRARQEIIVAIREPYQEESGYYQCGYSVDPPGVERGRFCAGVDAIQALVGAIEMAGTDLQFMNSEKYGGKLAWDAGPAEGSLPAIADGWRFRERQS